MLAGGCECGWGKLPRGGWKVVTDRVLVLVLLPMRRGRSEVPWGLGAGVCGARMWSKAASFHAGTVGLPCWLGGGPEFLPSCLSGGGRVLVVEIRVSLPLPHRYLGVTQRGCQTMFSRGMSWACWSAWFAAVSSLASAACWAACRAC